MDTSIPLKCCSRNDKCANPYGPWLPATTEYFSVNKRVKSGLRANCKACQAAEFDSWYSEKAESTYERKRQWRRDNPDKVKRQKNESQKRNRSSANQRNRKYRKIHSTELAEKRQLAEVRAKKQEYDRQYHRNHAGEKCAISQKWHRNNRERASARGRQWKASNPEKARLLARKSKTTRRAREFNAKGTYTPDDVRMIYEMQNGLCAYCGIRLFDKWHEDHYMPISRGGSNYPENIILACKECNLSKNDKTFEEWVLTRGW